MYGPRSSFGPRRVPSPAQREPPLPSARSRMPEERLSCNGSRGWRPTVLCASCVASCPDKPERSALRGPLTQCRLTCETRGGYCVSKKADSRIKQSRAPLQEEERSRLPAVRPVAVYPRLPGLSSPLQSGYFRFAREPAATAVPANASAAKATFADRTRCSARCTTSRRFRLATGRPLEADGRRVRKEASSLRTRFVDASTATSSLVDEPDQDLDAQNEQAGDQRGDDAQRELVLVIHFHTSFQTRPWLRGSPCPSKHGNAYLDAPRALFRQNTVGSLINTGSGDLFKIPSGNRGRAPPIGNALPI